MRPARPTRMHLVASTLAVLIGVCSGATGASAQGSWWPFGGNEPAPRPREPVYRQPPVTAPQAGQNPWTPRANAPGAGSNICLQLEQRLAAEGQRGTNSRDQLPRIEGEIRQLDRAYAAYAQRLDNNCYEYFLFSKSLRRTPQCVELAGQVDSTKRRLSELDIQRQQLLGSSGAPSYQDEIIRELARNNCGNQYIQEARKRSNGGASSNGLWQDEDNVGRSPGGNWGALPYATYRTICVRLCDGYFFPVSFSTLPNHFQQDSDLCQSRCAAPAELYYHQNPGGALEEAVSARNQTPYKSLRTAFRYRKELIQGCSCKEAEYVPSAGDKKAEAPLQSSTPALAARLPGR